MAFKIFAIIFLFFVFSTFVAVSSTELVKFSLPHFCNIEPTKAIITNWAVSPDAITELTTIIIVSPGENQVYSSRNVTLVVNIGVQPFYEDGANNHYIRGVSYKGDWMENAERIFYHLADGLMAQKISITLNINEIPNGHHSLTIYATDSYSIETSSRVTFTIDTQIQENIIHINDINSADYIRFYAFTLFSPLNRTYISEFLTLNLTFSAGMGIKYSLSYDIDGKYKDSIPYVVENPDEIHAVKKAIGYATLPELTEGSHNLTFNLIASGYQHRTLSYSETVYFTVSTQTQDNVIPEFPSYTIIPIIVMVTLLVIIYRNRLKRKSASQYWPLKVSTLILNG